GGEAAGEVAARVAADPVADDGEETGGRETVRAEREAAREGEVLVALADIARVGAELDFEQRRGGLGQRWARVEAVEREARVPPGCERGALGRRFHRPRHRHRPRAAKPRIPGSRSCGAKRLEN